MRIRTSDGSGTQYDLEIKDVRDYAHIEESEDSILRGTEICVTLRERLSRVVVFIRETFQFTDLAITYHYPSGGTETIGRRPISKSERISFGQNEFIDVREYPIASLKCSTGHIWYPLVRGHLGDEGNRMLILSNGIKICETGCFPRWVTLSHLSGVVDLRGNDRLDITASRSEIVRNEKFDALRLKIGEALYQVYADLLHTIRDHSNAVRAFFTENIRATDGDATLRRIIKEFYHFETRTNTRRKRDSPRKLGRQALPKGLEGLALGYAGLKQLLDSHPQFHPSDLLASYDMALWRIAST